MFKYSCIGDNTLENREHLEKIGYTVYENPDKKYIHPYTNQYQQAIAIGWGFEDIPKGDIDCRNNPALFKAVSAVRDDSDKWQFFVHEDGSFVLCDQSELKHVIDNEDRYQEYAVSEFHKATLSELQAHFQRV